MARKSPAGSSTTLDPSLAWIAVIIGAFSLYWYFKRRQPPRDTRPTVQGPSASHPQACGRTLRETIADGKCQGWKIAVTWDVLKQLSEDELSVSLRELSSSTNLHIIAGSADSSTVLAALKEVGCINRHQILFCSTEKGYEAFCRQLTPTVLVSTKTDLCQLLVRFVPWVVHVGSPSNIGRNVLDIMSFHDLPLLK